MTDTNFGVGDTVRITATFSTMEDRVQVGDVGVVLERSTYSGVLLKLLMWRTREEVWYPAHHLQKVSGG